MIRSCAFGTLAAAMLAGPGTALAEDEAAQLWSLFTEICTAALDDPMNIAAIKGRYDAEGHLGRTPDGFGTVGSLFLASDDTARMKIVVYTVTAFPEGTVSQCNLQIVGAETGMLPGLIDELDAAQDAFLDDAKRMGGPILVEDGVGLWIAWVEPGLPHDALSVQTGEQFSMLSMTRFDPARGELR